MASGLFCVRRFSSLGGSHQHFHLRSSEQAQGSDRGRAFFEVGTTKRPAVTFILRHSCALVESPAWMDKSSLLLTIGGSP
jgi:hypothetical protein